ncbi:MAG: glycoside hydrolase family 65 protein [Treponemataceae bacterium]|nr:glycoside hydrolase family 65 protein [Treponemataceae bacterium]
MTSSEWTFTNTGYSAQDILTDGNRLMTGNGYMGYRGTTEEAEKQDMPAIIINGIYDQQGSGWREPVNFPDPLRVVCTAGGTVLNLRHQSLVRHSCSLDFRNGVYSRRTTWNCGTGAVTVESRRFVSMQRKELLCLEYTVSATAPTMVDIDCSIDADVYDINGPHFALDKRSADAAGVSILTGHSLECGIPFAAAHCSSLADAVSVTVGPDSPCRFTVYGAVSVEQTNRTMTGEQLAARASAMVQAAAQTGFEALLAEQTDFWDRIWLDGDVVITGDPEAQKALRYSLYHLQVIAGRDNTGLSIPARGLSGQTYKGAIFWDTEIFIQPYFLYTNPELVKNFLLYRIHTLPLALAKARQYGYSGAFYPWESQENGDACSDYNVTDVFTGRPVKTYFRDKQIHISAAVVYALEQYTRITGDMTLLEQGGYQVIFECARFYASRVVYIPGKKRYELHDVIGPDEYHERVDNNAYTNAMALFTVQQAVDYIRQWETHGGVSLDQAIHDTSILKEYALLQDIAAKLYVPQPGPDGVIQQFDGYFEKEDCSLATVRSRLLHPQEYWGGTHGVASETRIIKQADVVTLINMLQDQYDDQVALANFEFYEPRTEHGSSLSACMYALLACRIGRSDWAYPFFRKTAETDLSGNSKQWAGTIYIGGTHPASSGGAWMSVVQGFCGFTVSDDGQVSVHPHLPKGWQKVEFTAYVRGKRQQITVTPV